MHVRSFNYEWDWERFAIRYMGFDGCYRMARALGYVPQKVPHAERLDAMFSHYRMPTNFAVVRKLVDLRNDLLHEALCAGGQPGRISCIGFEHANTLWRITDRLLFALAGYTGPYRAVEWWTIGRALI